jgi:hypothetical protein
MKRFTLFFTAALTLYLSGSVAYAQHGHGAGGAMAGAGTHGNSGEHGNADSATPNSTGSSTKSASSQLAGNQHLDTALTKALGNLVPPGGLENACQGFTNLGRCVSAIHVANNRKLDFFCLRKAMTGVALPTADTTPCSAAQTNLKLGPAIQTLDPSADSKVEATKAGKQANTDINTASHSQT